MLGTQGIWNVCSFDAAWWDNYCHMSTWLCKWQVPKVTFENLVYLLWLPFCQKMYLEECRLKVWLLFLYLFFSSIHHVHLLLSSTSNFMTEYFPYMIRSANVLGGAHVQWEIELLGFEIPKVIYKITSFLFFFFFWHAWGVWRGGWLWGVKKVRYLPFKKKKKHLIQNLFEMVLIVAYILRWLWNCGSAIVDHQTSFYLWMWTCWMVIWISKIWIYLILFFVATKGCTNKRKNKNKTG